MRPEGGHAGSHRRWEGPVRGGLYEVDSARFGGVSREPGSFGDRHILGTKGN